ncbi:MULTISPECIES: phage terminase large subunit family protein [unclassified Beijerinckia]|uniref:phage terminase large subunit family protein n=1 Tax=unclassified Beijerinckia TaxID=2638183 RepID=UPI0014805ABA|nr:MULTISPECIES: phage terminase large subunit family protein [unclassified Beijerinckia]
MSEWVIKNTRLKRKPYSFRGYEFQQKIIDDLHQNLCCIKCSQVGLTESQLRKYLGWLRRNPGTTGIYTMPDDKMRDRVSQTRVKPLITTEPVFNPPRGDSPVRQKGIYQIDDSFAYFTGNTEGDATSIPADILVHDELDLSDQENIGLFQSRLQNSDFKIRQTFSTPTFLGFGIDAMFNLSDQWEFFTRCPGCRQHQLPEFHLRHMHLPGLLKKEDDLTKLTAEDIGRIDISQTYWRCEKCSTQLHLGDTSIREWVAKHPSRTQNRGYRVRPTSIDRITIPYIFQRLVEHQRLDNMKGFFNTVLGEAYNDSNARISEADIKACMDSPGEPSDNINEPCTIGIDQGNICHITVGTPTRTLLHTQVPRNELKDKVLYLLKRFNIVSGAMDRYPDTTLAESIRDLEGYKGIIWPIHYGTAANSPFLKETKDEFDEITHWVAHRTKTLDQVATIIRNHKLSLNGFGHHQSLLINHLRGMFRKEAPDILPVWEKLTEEDHFFHSLGYMLLARRLVDVIFHNSEPELRSNALLIGGTTSIVPDLSPNSLNRRTPRSSLGMLTVA